MGPRALQLKDWKTLRWALLLLLAFCLLPPSEIAFAQLAPEQTSLQSAVQANVHSASGPELRLTLRLYNYAGLDSASLTTSEKVAGAILQNVGIEAIWVDCPTNPAKSLAYPACDSDMRTTDLVLRILPRHMAVKLHRSYDSLGSAQTCPETEPACELTVFYHRVDELAVKGYRADLILGHVIAHEVAHVLLGPRHSDDGILRAAWSSSELQRISLGMRLDFSTDQSKQLRLAVLRRIMPPVDRASTARVNLLTR
jgi:hypothetical protein